MNSVIMIIQRILLIIYIKNELVKTKYYSPQILRFVI